MTPQQRGIMAREMLRAMARGDTAWFEANAAEEVTWHVGGNSRSSGAHNGKAAVIALIAALDGALQLDIHDVLANDSHAVVLGVATATSKGKRVVYRFVNVSHIAHGRVLDVWGFAENDAAVDGVWDEYESQSETR